MCGIAGIAGEDRDGILRMTAALEHRGPDGNAVHVGNGASLGHCRLAILDPRPEGDQPMWNDNRTVAIVYNGEIFNFRELRDREGLACNTGTDTEVILRLYEKYGMGFVRLLRGMFAFGIYDTRTNSWHLARDGKGIKPLFIAYPGGKLAFASEMRALMKAMPTKPAINMTSLSRYLRLQYVPGPETLCEGIWQLPPGTVLTWKEGKEERRTFSSDEKTTYASKDDFKKRFPDRMDDIVRQHLVSDKPVGVFLSGGMDSSIILHHMSRHAEKPIKTFTVRFDATEDEGERRFNTDADLAKMTAAHYGTEHHEILLTAERFKDHYHETARALDQPNANGVAVAQSLLAAEAKKHVDVVLSGVGGDELFGGYPRYRIARILQLLSIVPPSLRALAGKAMGQPTDVLRMQPGPALAERLLARAPEEGAAIARGDWFDASATTSLFMQRFGSLAELDAVRAFMEFDRHLWLVDEALRLSDAVTMQSGLECRVPFVDERIIAASHATPSHWHTTRSRTKALLKDTYRPLLPDHLFTLSKSSFFPPVAKWLRREARPLVDGMLEHARMKELFNMEEVRSVYEKHADRSRYSMHTLSTLIQLKHWFDTVYDA